MLKRLKRGHLALDVESSMGSAVRLKSPQISKAPFQRVVILQKIFQTNQSWWLMGVYRRANVQGLFNSQINISPFGSVCNSSRLKSTSFLMAIATPFCFVDTEAKKMCEESLCC